MPQSLSFIWILATVVALGPLSTDMYLPSLPRLEDALSTSVSQVQITLSVFLAGFAVAQLVYGPLADRFGRKPILLIGLALFSIATLGCALAENIEQLISFRFLQALGACSGPVLGRTIVRDIYGAKDSARALSMMGSIMALAPAIAPIFGGLLLVWFDWQATFVFLAGYGGLVAVLIWQKVPESMAADARQPINVSALIANFGQLVKHRHYWGYCLSCSFVFAGLFSFLSGSSFILIDYFAVSEQHYGFFFAIIVMGYMSGTLISQRFGNRYGMHSMLSGASLLAALSGLAMAIPAWLQLHSLYWLIGCQFLFMMSVGMLMPQAMAGALAPFGHIAGTASALLGFIQSAIAATAGLIVGHMHSEDPTTMATTIACMGLLAGTSYLILVRQDASEAIA